MNAATETRAGHASVYAAVVAAKAAVKRIAKDNRNAEQKYEFASIDDFLAMVGPITAAHGLLTVIDEAGCEFIQKEGKYGPTQWVQISYLITTYHADGTCLPTVRRNVEVIRSGPQAYGSAQSYVLKQYYRGLLDIPTGDRDDPDFGGQREAEAPAAPPVRQPPAPPSPVPAIAALTAAPTLDALAEVWRGLTHEARKAPGVAEAKDARKAALTSPPASDIPPDDRIPF